MINITDETLKEIIKSAACDCNYTPENISEMYCISVDDAKDIINSHKSEIESEREYLKSIDN